MINHFTQFCLEKISNLVKLDFKIKAINLKIIKNFNWIYHYQFYFSKHLVFISCSKIDSSITIQVSQCPTYYLM